MESKINKKNLENTIIEYINNYVQNVNEGKNDFSKAKKNIKDGINDISKKFDKIDDFDEFQNLDEEIEQIKEEIESKYTNSEKICLVYIIGFLHFPILHLIGVQEMIIILNAMLNELIDELKLPLKKKARENDFYEVIQICSYKEIPDIDVAMLTSFIGIIAFEHLGFIATNIIFQSVPGQYYFGSFFIIFLFILEKN